jgi:hypothetical protein
MHSLKLYEVVGTAIGKAQSDHQNHRHRQDSHCVRTADAMQGILDGMPIRLNESTDLVAML